MSDRYGTQTRPDDIPEDVWYRCWWAQAHGLQEAASRHIMAANAEEREACAKIAQDYDGLGREPSEGAAYGDASLTQMDIAELIRSRT